MTFITMSSKELTRYNILQRLIRKELDNVHAAGLLQLSVRQVKRLKKQE